MNLAWKTGLSWTRGHFEVKPLHLWAKQYTEKFYWSGTDELAAGSDPRYRVPDFWTPWVSGGPFFYVERFLGITFYIGMRPTAPDPPGVPIEPWPGCLSRWFKRHGLGNFGIALRRAKKGESKVKFIEKWWGKWYIKVGMGFVGAFGLIYWFKVCL